MFTAAGTFKAKILDVKFTDPKFAQGPNDFDICIHVEHATDPSQSDWWRGEVSANYGKGNFATMTQAQITMKTLRNIGFAGDDLSTLDEQVRGREIPVTIKETSKDGKTYYNVSYIGAGGGNAPDESKVLDAASVKARAAALFGAASDAATNAGNPFAGAQGASAPSAPAAPTAPASTRPNPFAKK